jgi:hypothetical protein
LQPGIPEHTMAMPPSSPRLSAALIAPLALALAVTAAPAHAQTGGTTGTVETTTALAKEDFQFRFERPGSRANQWLVMNETDLMYFFNRARCECKAKVRLRIDLTASGVNKLRTRAASKGDLRVYIGANCATTQARNPPPVCNQIARTDRLDELVNGPLYAETTVDQLFSTVANTTDGGVSAVTCSNEGSQTFTLWLDNDLDNNPDLVDGAAPSVGITFDGKAPPVPRMRELVGGNEALQVSWDSLGAEPGFQGYIVFCARDGDKAVFPGHYRPAYDTAAGMCPDPAMSQGALQVDDADGGAGTDAGSDAAAGTDAGGGTGTTTTQQRGLAPAPLRALDPAYACSDLMTTGTKRRIYRLQNGIPYLVGVASVDKHGNASPIEEVLMAQPVPTRDFYRSYRDQGGLAEGGFCSLVGAGVHTTVPWLAGAVAAAGLALVVRRLRRRR